MTDAQINALYSLTCGVSHTAALRAIFTAGYAAHAGTAIGGGGDASHAAAVPTSVPIVTKPNDDDHR